MASAGFEDMILGDDEDDNRKLEEGGGNFTESLKTLRALAMLLACVKCKKVPSKRVYMLGNCTHKYCERCVPTMSGKPCVVCKEPSYPKDAKPDLFSTSVLAEIPQVYKAINGFGKKSCEKSGGSHKENEEKPDEDMDIVADADESIIEDEAPLVVFTPPKENALKMTMDDGKDDVVELMDDEDEVEVGNKGGGNEEMIAVELDCGSGDEEIIAAELDGDEELFQVESTPADQIIRSPDVLEETPQNKVSTSIVDLSKRRRSSGKKFRPMILPPTSPEPKKMKAKEDSSAKDEVIPDAEAEPKKMKEKEDCSAKKEVAPNAGPEPKKIKGIESFSATKDVPPNAEPEQKDEDGVIASDEELFRSPSKDREVEKTSPTDLPVLTPYIQNQFSKKEEEKEKKKKFFISKRKRISSDNEQDLPVLTPHRTVEVKDKNSGKNDKKTVEPKSKQTSKDVIQKKPKAEVKNVPASSSSRPQRPTPTMQSKPSKSIVTPKSTLFANLSLSDDSEGRKSSSRKRQVPAVSTPTGTGTPTSIHAKKGTPLGASKDKEKRNAKGETALHIACRSGHFEKVKNLVEGGADINAADNIGWSPLHETIGGRASLQQKMDIIRCLFACDKECNVNAVGGPEEETALHSAAMLGSVEIVELLLDFGASPNIRNSKGLLPVDLAFNEVIEKLLKEKTSGNNSFVSVVSESTSFSSSNFNSASTNSSEEDPAVIQVMLKKAVLYFNYNVDEDVLEKTRNVLKLKISDKLAESVTHIVHEIKGKVGIVPYSAQYLYGLAKGMWQVSSEWINQSICDAKCRSPTAFEVSGCSIDQESATTRFPLKSRMNREKGNPGLLNGFSFYLYKTCGYSSDQSESALKLGRRELGTLIQAAGGTIINREPDPNFVDPLESPQRFHVKQDSEGPFVLCSHIILYDEKAVPPEEKMYKMEHVKTLKSDWVIKSILTFNLAEPNKYL